MTRSTRTLGWTAAAVAAAAAAAVAACASSAAAWRRSTAASVSRVLGAARSPSDPSTAPSAAALAALPAPVGRYLAFALPTASPPIRTARVRWTGEFRMRPGGGWQRFEAEQHFSVRPPGFVWDARIHLLPLVPVRVRDGYAAGRGTMLGRVGGLVTVVDAGGTPEMAASALARWLGEAVWFPTALRPANRDGDGVRWEAVDDGVARATVTDGGVSASAEFHFAATGEITRMTALRHRDVDGTAVLTPFEGRYGDYELHDGVRVPTSAEVAWLLPDGRFPYRRGRPDAVTYDRGAAPRAPRLPA